MADLSGLEAKAALYVGTSRAKVILHVFLDQRCNDEYKQRAVEYGSKIALAS